jgi:hypothetical protein
LTVSASALTPARIRARPASSNRISLADMVISPARRGCRPRAESGGQLRRS